MSNQIEIVSIMQYSAIEELKAKEIDDILNPQKDREYIVGKVVSQDISEKQPEDLEWMLEYFNEDEFGCFDNG